MADSPRSHVADKLVTGTMPRDDGWAWLYDIFSKLAPRGPYSRTAVCAYFEPSRLEMAADCPLYRWLGVAPFGRFILLVRKSGWSKVVGA